MTGTFADDQARRTKRALLVALPVAAAVVLLAAVLLFRGGGGDDLPDATLSFGEDTSVPVQSSLLPTTTLAETTTSTTLAGLTTTSLAPPPLLPGPTAPAPTSAPPPTTAPPTTAPPRTTTTAPPPRPALRVAGTVTVDRKDGGCAPSGEFRDGGNVVVLDGANTQAQLAASTLRGCRAQGQRVTYDFAVDVPGSHRRTTYRVRVGPCVSDPPVSDPGGTELNGVTVVFANPGPEPCR